MRRPFGNGMTVRSGAAIGTAGHTGLGAVDDFLRLRDERRAASRVVPSRRVLWLGTLGHRKLSRKRAFYRRFDLLALALPNRP